MNDTIITFAGRIFTGEDIELIRWAAKTYPSLSRQELVSTVCEFLGWTDTCKAAKNNTMQFITRKTRNRKDYSVASG